MNFSRTINGIAITSGDGSSQCEFSREAGILIHYESATNGTHGYIKEDGDGMQTFVFNTDFVAAELQLKTDLMDKYGPEKKIRDIIVTLDEVIMRAGGYPKSMPISEIQNVKHNLLMIQECDLDDIKRIDDENPAESETPYVPSREITLSGEQETENTDNQQKDDTETRSITVPLSGEQESEQPKDEKFELFQLSPMDEEKQENNDNGKLDLFHSVPNENQSIVENGSQQSTNEQEQKSDHIGDGTVINRKKRRRFEMYEDDDGDNVKDDEPKPKRIKLSVSATEYKPDKDEMAVLRIIANQDEWDQNNHNNASNTNNLILRNGPIKQENESNDVMISDKSERKESIIDTVADNIKDDKKEENERSESVVIVDDPGRKKDAEEFRKYQDGYYDIGDILSAVIGKTERKVMMRFELIDIGGSVIEGHQGQELLSRNSAGVEWDDDFKQKSLDFLLEHHDLSALL